MASQCKARKKNGKRCPNPASTSGYCFTHDPARATERAAARKLGGFNRRLPVRVSGDEAVKVESMGDVLRLINSVIGDLWLLENSSGRGRALLSAADVAMRALTQDNLEARIAALEEIMRGNTQQTT